MIQNGGIFGQTKLANVRLCLLSLNPREIILQVSHFSPVFVHAKYNSNQRSELSDDDRVKWMATRINEVYLMFTDKSEFQT